MKLEFKKIGNLHKRWLTNITLVIVAVGVVCVAAITASYAAYCYKNMDADLQNRARTTTDYFKEAIGQDYDTFYQSCITYAETFDQADALELQFIDQYGKIVASSYGTWAATSPRTPEVQEAISTRTIQPFVGRDPDTGERIMAVSSPMIYSNGQVIGVLRYVTSTAIMDREIVSIAFISITVLVAALVIILLFSSFFIRSVMLPVEQITEKAKRIANGSYGAQIKTKYNDEIADLAETINEMSVKISQNEKMQAEFISQLSHELRTPLTVINGWSETLLADESLDADTAQGLKIISSEAKRLTEMVMELLDWTKNSDVHMLIRSCVFHYELELIHPFTDGNGRVGRLWHTLLLSQWNPTFAWLPVESIIHDRQQEYYAAINASNDAGESTVFIEFMLSAIKTSLIDAINTSDEMSDGAMDKATMRRKQIEKFLETHPYIMNADVRALFDVSSATANRILADLVTRNTLVKCRINGHWAYKSSIETL